MNRLMIVLTMILLASCGPSDGITSLELRPVGNEMKFDQTVLTATAGTTVRLSLINTATLASMVHNFVLLESGADVDEVGSAALEAGLEREFIPDHPLIVVFTPLASPGETETIEFEMPPPGEYPFICTYPGHWVTMKGILKSIP